MRSLTIGNINHGCNQLSIYSREVGELLVIFFRTEVVLNIECILSWTNSRGQRASAMGISGKGVDLHSSVHGASISVLSLVET